MKVLDVDSLMSGVEDGVRDIDDMHEKISAVQRSIRDFFAMEDALRGKGGDAIRYFFNEVHQPFLIFLYQSLQDYKTVLTKMQNSVEAFEPNPSGIIRQDFLETDVTDGFDKAKDRTMALTDDANRIIGSVQDLVAADRIDDTAVLESVDRGKKKVRNIVEDMNALDKTQVQAMESVRADLQTMKSYLADVEVKVERGDLSPTEFDIGTIRDIDGYSTVMDRIYNNDKTIENMSMIEIEKAKNVVIDDLDEYGKQVLSEAYKALETGEIDKNTYQSIFNLLLDTEEELAKVKEQDKNAIIHGEVVFEGRENGQHTITKGVDVDIENLGIDYRKLPFDDHDIHYTIEDGKFIIFKDNPDLYYYTQSAKQGKFNYYTAGVTNSYAKVFSTVYLKKGLDKVPGLDKVISKIDPKLVEFGKYGGSWWLKDQVPYMKDILGAEIPQVGDKEVILYISEDGEIWDKGVRFVVKKGEEPIPNKFHPNRW
ncbi:ribonuclease YeeF family protein [Virgibacillus kimchii]